MAKVLVSQSEYAALKNVQKRWEEEKRERERREDEEKKNGEAAGENAAEPVADTTTDWRNQLLHRELKLGRRYNGANASKKEKEEEGQEEEGQEEEEKKKESSWDDDDDPVEDLVSFLPDRQQNTAARLVRDLLQLPEVDVRRGCLPVHKRKIGHLVLILHYLCDDCSIRHTSDSVSKS